MGTYIIIPSYNANEKLTVLIEDIYANHPFIILIDDGSTKLKSQQILKNICINYPNIILLKHESNKGKGAAIKTGILYVINSLPLSTNIITADDDGQHTAYDVLNIISKINDDPEHFFLGTRTFSSGAPWKSIIGNRISTNIVGLFFGTYIHDTQSGLRGLPSHLLRQLLLLPGERYEFETEVIIYLLKNNILIKCIPISTLYFEQNIRTNFRPVQDSFRIFKTVTRNLFISRQQASIK